MSNSIWKMPDQKPKYGKQLVWMAHRQYWFGWYDDGKYIDRLTEYRPDVIDRWCYLDDLIAQADKAERLQKAVDLAVDTLKKAETTRELTVKGHYVHAISLDELHSALEEIKQLIKGE